MNGLAVYSTFIACRLHFEQGDFDAFKFNFKCPSKSIAKYKQSVERFACEKLAKKYQTLNELVAFFVGNIISGFTWINEMNEDAYLEWKGRLQSMQYRFNTDMQVLADYCENQYLTFDECLIVRSGAKIPVIDLVARGSISIESACMLNVLTKFAEKKCPSDPLGVISNRMHTIKRYTPFLLPLVNVAAAKNTIAETFSLYK